MIIIISKDEILKADRITTVEVNIADTNIVAKLDRESVILGTYSKEQVKEILSAIRDVIVSEGGVYEMSERWKK